MNLRPLLGFTLFSCLAFLALICPASSAGGAFPWQEPHAKVLPGGELEYQPEPFRFEVGDSVRYIDYEAGSDTNPGTREAPWKHHPWDPASTAKAEALAIHTYVFKGGVTYRGRFIIPDGARGTPENPIRLTRDPAWGDGPAVISGAQPVTGWTQTSHPKMPECGKVWMAEVDFFPRNLWMIKGTEPTRLKLARWPNWEESEPNDLMSEWPAWDQPEWWKNKNTTKIGKNTKHVGIAKSLPRPLEDLVGGTVWSEWGIVMGSPYPARVEGVAEVQQGDRSYEGIVFRGPWTYDALERIITANRYYLENLPQFLDQPGEFWAEKTGEQSARIYLRLPGDVDPNQSQIEAARHYDFFQGKQAHHIHWSGLTFRFGNVGWDFDHPRWARPNLIVAAIHIEGAGDGIVITHNTFEHLPMPIRIHVADAESKIGRVSINDNHMRDTEHGAVEIANFTGGKPATMGQLGHVDFLRNRLERIGMRILSGEHGHAVDVRFPETSHMAGNFLHRIGGWGLAVFGGKPSGNAQAGLEAPLSRHLIHHNRVEDALLKSNDWGGIETWQGGSFYVFNNIVINALGFKNWIHASGNKDQGSSFGHAYYMDGSFKNYLFNNIGLGRNNELGSKGVNLTAIQNIISFENWYFNNSFHRFVVATRQQEPDAGRFRYLGNAFSDVSQMLYRHADPKEGKPDPNAEHFTQGGAFDYPTIAYSQNIGHDLVGKVGVFEETGVVYEKAQDFDAALKRVSAQATESVRSADSSLFRNPDAMDWRPTSALSGNGGHRVFVPWGLARTVGEWSFNLNRSNPNEIIDEHWFMTAAYADRKEYKNTPRYPLIGVGLDAENYVASPLEDWTSGAITLDGRAHFLRLPRESLGMIQIEKAAPEAPKTRTVSLPFGEVVVPEAVQLGTNITAEVTLNPGVDPGTLNLHLHWMKPKAFGGFATLGGKPEKLADNRYRFTVPADQRDQIASFNLLIFLSPDGNWPNNTQNASVPVALDKAAGVAITADQLRTVDVGASNFLIESIFRTTDGDGVLVQMLTDQSGYQVKLKDGKIQFAAGDGGQIVSLATDQSVADGQWHHFVAEFDRNSMTLRVYLDGKAVAEKSAAEVAGSLSNNADLLVGGVPDGTPEQQLAGDIDFLRIALATLADSRTTIEELHAWQFHGPQFRDFVGQDRQPSNSAGALAR